MKNAKSSLCLFLFLFFCTCQPSGIKKVEADQNEPEETETVTETGLGSIKPPQHITSLYIPSSLTFAGEAVPLERTDVREALEYELTVNTFRHSHTLLILKNVERWRPLVTNMLHEAGVPEDFLYLAVIESEFNNTACSYAGAMGMWQIMKSTAKDCNLTINRDVDMRRDPKLATRAACKFLKWTHSNLDSWTLSAASYNLGMKGIKNRIEDQKVTSFYDLHLNSETGRYVYRILAMKLILENPKAYGYFIKEDDKYAPYRFTTITVTATIKNLVDFALEHHTTYKELRLLNPWFNNTSNFRLNIGRKDSFEIRIPMVTSISKLRN